VAGLATMQHSLLESSHGPCSRKGARRARRSDARAVAKAQLAPWSAVAAEPSVSPRLPRGACGRAAATGRPLRVDGSTLRLIGPRGQRDDHSWLPVAMVAGTVASMAKRASQVFAAGLPCCEMRSHRHSHL